MMRKIVLLLVFLSVLEPAWPAQRGTIPRPRNQTPPRTNTSLQQTSPVLREYISQFPVQLQPFADDWDKKYQTLQALIKSGPTAVPLLIRGLETDYQLHTKGTNIPLNFRQIGRHCAIALAQIGEKSAAERLIKYIDFPDVSAQREVIYALGKLGNKEAIPALLDIWADPDVDMTNKREAAFALVRIGSEAAGPMSTASIQSERSRLAISALLKIALSDEQTVITIAKTSTDLEASKRSKNAISELRQRRKKWGQMPEFDSLFSTSAQLLGKRDSLDAVQLWERVIDSGLYSIDQDEAAREQILKIKNQAGIRLYAQPLCVSKNKVFILKNYDGVLPPYDGKPSRRVTYSLSNDEVECIKKRFDLFDRSVTEGSCGALKVVNEIEVVEEPWGKFRETIRQAPENMGRYQISRTDLIEKFDFKNKYLNQGYGCVFFQMRGDLKTFEMDGGAAGGSSVLNAQQIAFDTVDATAIVHEWMHVLHGWIWGAGYDWMQCLPLHDQIRNMTLQANWRNGKNTRQEEIFVDCMRRYITASMWKSLGDLPVQNEGG